MVSTGESSVARPRSRQRRALIVKLSSLGDVLHTLPAVSDAASAIPNLRFDWVVEEALAEIPAWHPAVDRVLRLPHRRWRRSLWSATLQRELPVFLRSLRQRHYDHVIDAQGLLAKSAWVALLARGPATGLDWRSAREPLASLCYGSRVRVSRNQHAVLRLRQLFASTLQYSLPATSGHYGIHRQFADQRVDPRKLVVLHGTTWETKLWPETYWSELIDLAEQAALRVHLTWGNAAERQRCERLAIGRANVVVLARMPLTALARELATARAAVTVDTGLGHLAAALGVPAVALYGPTATARIGTWGDQQRHLIAQFPCAPCVRRTCVYRGPRKVEPPCFGTITPRRVWSELQSLLSATAAENRHVGGTPEQPSNTATPTEVEHLA